MLLSTSSCEVHVQNLAEVKLTLAWCTGGLLLSTLSLCDHECCKAAVTPGTLGQISGGRHYSNSLHQYRICAVFVTVYVVNNVKTPVWCTVYRVLPTVAPGWPLNTACQPPTWIEELVPPPLSSVVTAVSATSPVVNSDGL